MMAHVIAVWLGTVIRLRPNLFFSRMVFLLVLWYVHKSPAKMIVRGGHRNLHLPGGRWHCWPGSLECWGMYSHSLCRDLYPAPTATMTAAALYYYIPSFSNGAAPRCPAVNTDSIWCPWSSDSLSLQLHKGHSPGTPTPSCPVLKVEFIVTPTLPVPWPRTTIYTSVLYIYSIAPNKNASRPLHR